MANYGPRKTFFKFRFRPTMVRVKLRAFWPAFCYLARTSSFFAFYLSLLFGYYEFPKISYCLHVFKRIYLTHLLPLNVKFLVMVWYCRNFCLSVSIIKLYLAINFIYPNLQIPFKFFSFLATKQRHSQLISYISVILFITITIHNILSMIYNLFHHRELSAELYNVVHRTYEQ